MREVILPLILPGAFSSNALALIGTHVVIR
jgi:hypothetical protein